VQIEDERMGSGRAGIIGPMSKAAIELLGLAFACAAFGAQAQGAAPGQTSAPANLLAEAAREIGVKQCLPALSRLSALAITGSRAHDVLLDWDRAKPDAGPLFSLLGLSYGGQSAAATITVIPQPGGDCTVAAERISVAPFTCDSIAQVELKGYKLTRLLPNFNVYTQPSDPGASVSLIDSPPSCLVIRRHVQYGWTALPSTPPAR
jgi:hypothetical protein